MKLLQILNSILNVLGYGEKAKNKELTSEETAKLAASVKTETGMELDEFLAKVSEEMESANNADQTHQETLNTLSGIFSKAIPTNGSEDNDDKGTEDSTNVPPTSQNVIESAQKIVDAFSQMANRATEQKPIDTAAPIIGLNGPGTTATHFLGISHGLFDRKKRWNEIAALGGYGSMSQNPTPEQIEAFNTEFSQYGSSLATRYEELRKSNRLDAKLLSSFENDYSGLDSAKLGDQYLVRRQDALIAHLIKFYNVHNIFPRRYNVQDRDVLFSAFFKQVSQAWQKGKVFKGGMSLQPEMAHVDDAMIKLQFEPMKDIERMYIGYLNQEGSYPMKWSMIEWQLVNIMEVAINEQNHRRIMGIYVAPEEGVPGHYLHSSTGVFYTLFRYYVENKLKLHDDPDFCGYTKDTMLQTVQDMIEQIILDASKDHTVNIKKGFRVILNENHRAWWKANCRAKYGKDLDFTGPDSMMNKVPDLEVNIVWLPNTSQLPWILIDEPGNIQLIENVPGEMLAMRFDREMELYLGWSIWKEGCGASFVGKHFNSKDDLDKNKYHLQRIFMNAPLLFLDADATEIDGTAGFWFRSQGNTAAAKLSEIKNPEFGVAYIVEAGDDANPTAIDKAGQFSEIAENYAPTKKGDYIMLVLNTNGDKFLELERRVGGVRTINKKLQPNIIGAR